MNDFKDMKVIACGQYSQVFSAKQRKENKLYAIKKYVKKSLTRQRIAPNVSKEIEIMQNLAENPFTCRLYNHFEDREAIYLVLEYANNGNMQQKLLKDKKLSEQETLYYARQMLDILEHIHKNHITHRNFKLENLLIKKNEKKQMTLKLCDFGFGTYVQHDTGIFSDSDHFGPEQFNLQPQSEAIDIWTFGIIVHQMLTGKFPFEPRQEQLKGKKRQDVLQNNIVNANYNTKSLSEGLKDLLNQVFQINPSKRPTATQLKEHWWIIGNQRPNDKINIISILENEEEEEVVQPQLPEEPVQVVVDVEVQISQARQSVLQKIQSFIKPQEMKQSAVIKKINKIEIFKQQTGELEKQLKQAEEKLEEIKNLNEALQSELILKSEQTTHLSDERESVVSYLNYNTVSRQNFCKIQKQKIPLFEGEKFCLEQTIQTQNELNQIFVEQKTDITKCLEEIETNQKYIQELETSKKLLTKQISDFEEKRNFMKLEAGIIGIQQQIEQKLQQLHVDYGDRVQILEIFNKTFTDQNQEEKRSSQKKVVRTEQMMQVNEEAFPEKKQLKIDSLKNQIAKTRELQNQEIQKITENTQILSQTDEQELQQKLQNQAKKKEEMNDQLKKLEEVTNQLVKEMEEQEKQIAALKSEKQELEKKNLKSNIVF